MKNKPIIIAHRGYSGKFPENTMIAFEEAILAQAQMIEFDVHLTRDFELIVTHDYILGRTVKAKGSINDYTLDELKNFDCGSWFDDIFSNQRLLSLKEVFTLVDKRVSLNVELKHETLKSLHYYEVMAKKVLDLINEMGYRDLVIISSFDEKILQVLRQYDPRIRLGVLDHTPNFGIKFKLINEIKAYSYHPNFLKLEQSDVEKLHAQNLLIYPYTANSTADFERLQKQKVNGIITNQIEDLLTYLEKTL